MKTSLALAVGFFLMLLTLNSFAAQVIDGQGNVIYYTENNLLCSECNVFYKLNGRTGAILWKSTLSGVYFPTLLLDKRNDIIATGKGDFSYLQKYSGSTGQFIWEADASSLYMVDTQLDKNGYPVVNAYDIDGYLHVIKFDPGTGNKIWSRRIDIQ